jgi:hypothetical protein
MIKSQIIGGNARQAAQVTSRGQLVTSPLEFSTFYTASTATNNVAVNVITPLTGKQFVITAIILSADRSVGANGAVTDLFEASADDSETIDKAVITEELAKQTRMVATNLNILVTKGKWVNLKSDDVIVRANVSGYYVNAE